MLKLIIGFAFGVGLAFIIAAIDSPKVKITISTVEADSGPAPDKPSDGGGTRGVDVIIGAGSPVDEDGNVICARR